MMMAYSECKTIACYIDANNAARLQSSRLSLSPRVGTLYVVAVIQNLLANDLKNNQTSGDRRLFERHVLSR